MVATKAFLLSITVMPLLMFGSIIAMNLLQKVGGGETRRIVVADGTPTAAKRLERVLTSDPGMGVIRHADAGYDEAIKTAEERGVVIPRRR